MSADRRLRALPTRYGSITMRSRLEADWALYLDKLRIRWQYEPEGYRLSDGSCYSPDFYLPRLDTWLEVKGEHVPGVRKVEQFADDLWAESGCETFNDPGAPMVIIGQSPEYMGIDGEWARYYATRGPGRSYSTLIARCPLCERWFFMATWQDSCRACGHVFSSGMEAFADSVDGFALRFPRNPRPVGGQS